MLRIIPSLSRLFAFEAVNFCKFEHAKIRLFRLKLHHNQNRRITFQINSSQTFLNKAASLIVNPALGTQRLMNLDQYELTVPVKLFQSKYFQQSEIIPVAADAFFPLFPLHLLE